MTPTRPPLVRLYDDEVCADLFAGGGGASTGLSWILQRPPDIAINHNREALAMHRINHPETEHRREDLHHADPVTVCKGKRVGVAWFSPDCTYHSKAKGGKPFRDRHKARKIRGLAWVIVRWAESPVKPRVIFMENVEEIVDWGPLIEVRRGEWIPDPSRRGQYWRKLVRKLQRLGYVVEWRELRASDFGAPTSRKRLFMIARCDGQPIVWPHQPHAPAIHLQRRTAADCIDFSLPVPSIFMTREEAKAWGRAYGVPPPKRPLADPTLRRVARGVVRYVVESPKPFIVPITHGGDSRIHSVDEPLRTITCSERGEFALVQPELRRMYDQIGDVLRADGLHYDCVAPTLINTRNGERHGRHGEQAPRVLDIEKPYPTITAQGSQGALVAAFLSKYHGQRHGDREARGQSLFEPIRTLDTSNRFALTAAYLAKHNGGHEATGQELRRPMDTIVCRENKALVAANLVKLYGTCRDGQSVDAPAPTVTAFGNHVGLVSAFLVKYFGTGVARSLALPLDTVTTRDRYGLVTVTIDGDTYVLVDIGMRMLTPPELYRCQGFPDDYVIDRGLCIDTGHILTFTKGMQTKLCGNAVPPHFAAAIAAANLIVREEATA